MGILFETDVFVIVLNFGDLDFKTATKLFLQPVRNFIKPLENGKNLFETFEND